MAYLNVLYQDAVGFLQSRFDEVLRSGSTGHRYRAFYPQISVQVDSFRSIDSRLSFGHVTSPSRHTTTITRSDLFVGYLRQQIELPVETMIFPFSLVRLKRRFLCILGFPMKFRRILMKPNRSPFCLKICLTFLIWPKRMMISSMAMARAQLKSQCLWCRSRRSALIILWRAWRITPPRIQAIFRTMCFSQIINFMWQNLKSMRAALWPI